MKKFLNNPWVIAIGSTVVGGVLLTLVNDWINEIDWLSTLKAVLRFIGNMIIAFLNFELKVWWVLVTIAFLGAAFVIFILILSKKTETTPVPFLSYRKDSVLGYTWEWDYEKIYDGNYTITNLHPICSKCGMRLKQDGAYGLSMECLRCGISKKWELDYLVDAQMLIEDNIKKAYLQNN